MKNLVKKTGISICGFLQGILGSYFAILGFVFAFPQAGPGSKDYDDELAVVPFGYIIIFIWLVVMAAAFILLRKSKENVLLFLISWFVGVGGFLVFIFH